VALIVTRPLAAASRTCSGDVSRTAARRKTTCEIRNADVKSGRPGAVLTTGSCPEAGFLKM